MSGSNKHNFQWIYKTAAFLLPFIFLFFIELSMRLLEYGYNTDLFIDDGSGKYYLMNPDISKKYFTIEENATIGHRERFSKIKKPGTMRFFVLGASSSLGYPYMHNGSFPGMLKYRLQFAYPDVDFEIINLSLTAVNSYCLYDFSKQLIKYAPDAVLIYAGHNEYYGALGVASTSTIGRNPKVVRAIIAAKRFKLVQWVSRIAAKMKGSDKRITDYTLTLMERMTEEQSVPYRSAVFQQGIKQFDCNLHDMLEIFNKFQIPVYIGNLVSNQKDQKPFISASGEFDADLQFKKGNEAYSRENYSEAKEHFILAKEYDELRFRAPEEMNEIIRKYSDKFNNVTLVEVLELLEKNSPNGIIDSTLLLEHVHPNLKGHRLISDAFYKALDASELFSGKKNNDFSFHIDEKEYPFTSYDTIYGEIIILLLKELWPFNEPMPEEDPSHIKTYEEQLAGASAVKQITWYQAMQELYGYYEQQGNKAGALRIMERMSLNSPYNEDYLEQSGKLCLQLNNDTKAWFYFMKANALNPSSNAASNMAIAFLKMDMPDKAMPYINRVIRDSRSKVDFLPLKLIAEDIIDLKKQLSANPENPELRKKIAFKYQCIGNQKAASLYSD